MDVCVPPPGRFPLKCAAGVAPAALVLCGCSMNKLMNASAEGAKQCLVENGKDMIL
jgi:hypothetical protein